MADAERTKRRSNAPLATADADAASAAASRAGIARLREYIELHYPERLTLDRLARVLGWSKRRLTAAFAEHAGQTVHDYLTEVRLRHAGRLIRDGVKIEAVGLLVGYRSAKSFHRAFKSRYVLPPLQFRRETDLQIAQAAMTHFDPGGERWSGPGAGAPQEVKERIAEQLTADRAQTDEGLAQERVVTDQLIGRAVEEVADDARATQREEIDRELDQTREQSDERRSAAGDLPAVAATLVSAAESLTEVAESLSNAAQVLAPAAAAAAEPALGRAGEEAVTALADIADTLAEVAQGDDAEAREESTSESPAPALTDGLAEVAESLADVATRIAEERLIADESLQEERRLLDELLDRERDQADAVLDFERHQRRRLVEAARRRTDGLLRVERENTDTAVDESVHLLSHEHSARASAEQALMTRDELLAIISHDLRAPLDVVVINAALLSENAPAGAEGARARRWAANIERAAGVMDRLLSDLTDVARFEGGEFRLTVAEHDAVSIVKECVETFAPVAARAGLTLDVELPDAPTPAHYDHDRLFQVLSNLLRNAMQVTPRNGSVVIALSAAGNGCRIAVRDTGPGIPSSDLERIFERFRRLESNERPGLGLGLYIARRIVSLHGGRIWAESTLGRGSTFTIELPGHDCTES